MSAMENKRLNLRMNSRIKVNVSNFEHAPSPRPKDVPKFWLQVKIKLMKGKISGVDLSVCF